MATKLTPYEEWNNILNDKKDESISVYQKGVFMISGSQLVTTGSILLGVATNSTLSEGYVTFQIQT